MRHTWFGGRFAVAVLEDGELLQGGHGALDGARERLRLRGGCRCILGGCRVPPVGRRDCGRAHEPAIGLLQDAHAHGLRFPGTYPSITSNRVVAFGGQKFKFFF